MLDILIFLFGFLFVLTVIVFIHEYGHFWAARRSGVYVEVFSIGFGQELFGWNDKHGTRWRFSAIPLGGYVRMRGDKDPSGIPDAAAVNEEGSFMSASLASRAFIVSMGPIANFILGISIFAVVFMLMGKAFTPPVIDELIEGSAADQAGLQIGDRILTVNGYAVDDFNDLRMYVAESPGRELIFTVDRDGRVSDIPVTPARIIDECRGAEYGQLGVVSRSGEVRQLGFGASIMAAVEESYTLSLAMLRGLGRLITGQANKGEMGGPVKIAEITGEAAQNALDERGFIQFLILIAALSINLGFVNLMPVPALDGGHLVFFGLEAVMRKPLSPKYQEWIMRLGIAFLLTLIVMFTFFDVMSWVTSPC
jgi:regulator of sigma E protease